MAARKKKLRVRLHRHQAPAAVSAFDLNTVQANVQTALDQLSAEVEDAVYDNTQVAGNVNAPQLDAQLLQGFRVEVQADTTGVLPNQPISFKKTVFGGDQWVTPTALGLKIGCKMHIDGRVTLWGGGGVPPTHPGHGDTALVPGARAQLQMIDNALNVVMVGPWTEAVVTSDGVVQIEASIEGNIVLAAGTAKKYAFRYIGQRADGGTVTTWCVAAPNLSASPAVGGSYIDGIVVP